MSVDTRTPTVIVYLSHGKFEMTPESDSDLELTIDNLRETVRKSGADPLANWQIDGDTTTTVIFGRHIVGYTVQAP